MSRVTTIVGAAIALSMFAVGCQASLTVKTKTQYVESGVTQSSPDDWKGESIVIKDEGSGQVVGDAGLKIVFDSSVTKVTATATMNAWAFPEDKALADQSRTEAKQTFQITSDGTTMTVACGHGQSHGSSDSGASGCAYLEVHVPAGSATQAINVNGQSGNGDLTVNAKGAVIGTLQLTQNGTGDVDVSADANKDSTLTITSEQAGDVTLHLPSDFAADSITLNADAQSIITTDFSDVKSGSGRGTAGTGAKAITVTSREFAGSTGKVTLTSK